MGRMEVRNLRRAWLGATAAVISGAILIALLIRPDEGGRLSLARLGPPMLLGAACLGALWYVFGLFERQQDHIERQRREIETQHALDTTILAELDEPGVLKEAVTSILRALDAEAAGIVLLDPETKQPRVEEFQIPDRPDTDRERFYSFLRSGGRPNPEWETEFQHLGDAGDPVGYLGAGRFRPCRPFSYSESALLALLKDTVLVALANVRALQAARDAERVKEALERERRVARALTEELLPNIPPRIGPWAFARRYEAQSPDAPVGGDIYDLFPLGPGCWGVLIADVSGKGLAAAKKTAMIKYALRSFAREHQSPARVVTRLNEALCEEPDITEFVTLVYGILYEDGRFVYVNAGHEPPIVRRADGAFEVLGSTGLIVGLQHDTTYEEASVRLLPNDGLLLFTDGLSESRSKGGEDFLDTEGVQRLLEDLRGVPPEELPDRLLESIPGALSDDTALLWIERMLDTRENGHRPRPASARVRPAATAASEAA
jgi:serine phosphatase RsbU (regulator of sigma subunit)